MTPIGGGALKKRELPSYDNGEIIQLGNRIIPTVSNEIILKLNEHRDKIRGFIDENPRLGEIPGVFPPDWWSENQLTPVSYEVANSNKPLSVFEMGVGSGFNLMYLIINFLEERKLGKLIGSDIVKDAVNATRRNIEGLNMSGLNYELFTSDGFNDISPEALKGLDIMFACLPQVYLPGYNGGPIDLSNYYIKENYKGKYNDVGFGLIEKIIKQAIDRIPDTKILMNVSGRINQNVIKKLFEEIGYNIKIAYEQMIPHHMGTSLGMYVDIEKTYGEDVVGDFYINGNIGQKVSAKEAEKIRKGQLEGKYEGDNIYHKLHVIEGIHKDNVIYFPS